MIRPGDVQHTSSATGIRHSEWNHHPREDGHILQIWAQPAESAAAPAYYTRHHSRESKTNCLAPVIMPAGSFPPGTPHKLQDAASADPIPIAARLAMYACILEPGQSVTHRWAHGSPKKGGIGYVHVAMETKFKTNRDAHDPQNAAQGRLRLEGERSVDRADGSATLVEGDGAFVTETRADESLRITSTGDKPAHFLLFDMAE